MSDERTELQSPVPVMLINNTTLIPIVKSLLNAAQIRYFIKNERAHDLVGYARLTTGGYNQWWQPEVLVEASRAAEARELLEAPLRDASEAGTDGQTSLRSFTQPSGLTVVGLWLAFGPTIPMLGLWIFATNSTPPDIFGDAIAAAVMIIIAEVLWTVTVNYLRAKAATKDEANA